VTVTESSSSTNKLKEVRVRKRASAEIKSDTIDMPMLIVIRKFPQACLSLVLSVDDLSVLIFMDNGII